MGVARAPFRIELEYPNTSVPRDVSDSALELAPEQHHQNPCRFHHPRLAEAPTTATHSPGGLPDAPTRANLSRARAILHNRISPAAPPAQQEAGPHAPCQKPGLSRYQPAKPTKFSSPIGKALNDAVAVALKLRASVEPAACTRWRRVVGPFIELRISSIFRRSSSASTTRLSLTSGWARARA